MNEAVSADELMLNKNAVLVPIRDFRCNFESLEDPDELAEANVGGAQKNLPALTSNDFVKPGSNVKVDSRHVDFPQVASVVHVSEDHVDIFGRADS